MNVLPDSMNLNTLDPEALAKPINREQLPLLQEWAYDFERNELALNDAGRPYLVSGNEALKIWIYWAITTDRYKYSANSKDYGSEINTMIGLPITRAVKLSELERTIRDTIMVCPYVKRITNLDIEVDDDIVIVDVDIESVYEKGWVSVSVKV